LCSSFFRLQYFHSTHYEDVQFPLYLIENVPKLSMADFWREIDHAEPLEATGEHPER
jgi:hypothetical protein